MNVVCRLVVAGVVVSAALTAAACGSSSPSSPTSPTPSGSVTVSMPVGASGLGPAGYAPNPVAITAGGSVTWVNNDSITHTATSDTGMFDSGNIAPSGKFSFTFPNKGSFTYHCTIHPGMIATVNVQ